ncbi:BTB/POZ domain-containing protein, partial [Stagonosporopsis vannaccii]
LDQDPSEAEGTIPLSATPRKAPLLSCLSAIAKLRLAALEIASASRLLGRLRPRRRILRLGHMPDPSNTTNPHYLVPPSPDQASSYSALAYSRYNAPEGNAYAQGGYATPTQAFPQDTPLIYHDQSSQQPQQPAPSPFPGYHSLDAYAQIDWGWAHSPDFTQLSKPYEPQGELLHELRDRKDPTDEFSSPLLVNPLAPPPRPLPQRPADFSKMKRKSDSEVQAIGQQGANEQQLPMKRRAVSRASSTASQSPAPTILADAQPSPIANVAQIAASANQSSIQSGGETQWHKNAGKGTGPRGREIDVSEPRRVVESSSSSDMLPAGRVFPIQIGSALFRLSGASICSDAPSHFSHFFSEQLHDNGGRVNDVRTLYIDRDPETFRDIALHLQGYHIVPRDGEHFVKLFADAQFYSLPRLTKQLFKSDIFISIGGTPFRIPRDSFSAPGDSPNYFSLGFAQWFSTPSEVFPGLDRNALLRPPSISPPSVPNKSGDIFAELMRMLQGYEVEIRSETHRANLLRDARYFHLKGLEQKLVPCEKNYNLKKGQNEILMRLEDIRQSGVSFLPDDAPNNSDLSISIPGYVSYARPYTDDATSNSVLVLETSSGESTTLHLSPSFTTNPDALSAEITFHGDTLRRMTALLKIVASKMGLPSTQSLTQTQPGNPLLTAATPGASEARFKVLIDSDCALTVDGQDSSVESAMSGKGEEDQGWVVRRAHWRLRVESADNAGEAQVQAVLEAVKVEAFTRERPRNAKRRFLGAA